MSAPKQPALLEDPGPVRAAASEWGSWTLGDLRDEFSRLVEIISPSTSVLWVDVAPPSEEMPFPQFHVAVRLEQIAEEIRHDVEYGAYLSAVQPESNRPCWCSVVGGMYVRVHVEGAHA